MIIIFKLSYYAHRFHLNLTDYAQRFYLNLTDYAHRLYLNLTDFSKILIVACMYYNLSLDISDDFLMF